MRWSVIAAVNNEALLADCLLQSPDLPSAEEVLLQRGFTSASLAYNDALRRATGDLLVFVHQDVFLPPGWIETVRCTVSELERRAPEWGVLGVWGVTDSGRQHGHAHWPGREWPAGQPFAEPVPVQTLDELLLIVRRSAGLRFDESLPGFHLYGADLCLEARRRGLTNYAVDAFCIHNTATYGFLPIDFWRGYMYLRRKWRSALPIHTSCTVITRFGGPAFRWNAVRAVNLLMGRHPMAQRGKNPKREYEELVRRGAL
jgi:GT2 family glycosyltransferase